MVRSVGLVARQSWFLPVVLVGISAVSSWEFACITPFVAFAVAAGYALSARVAVLTVMAIWLVNQAIGFGVLGYPWTVDTMLWGFAIGATALLAAVLASAVMRLRLGDNVIAIGAAFVVAFAAYGRVVSDDLHPRRTGCIHAGNRRPCRAAEPRMDSGSRRNL